MLQPCLLQFLVPTDNQEEDHLYNNDELTVMNKTELRDICLKHGYSRNGNKNDLITRILKKQEERVRDANISADDDEVKSRLMKRWFQKPITNNTSIKMGQACEPLIASNIPLALNNGHFKIYDVTEVGLVRSQESNYLATSVDRLAVIEIKKEMTLMHNLVDDEEDVIKYNACIEIKCMTKNETKNEAIERISNFESNFLNCVFGDKAFMELVWTQEYRTQCLHIQF